MPTMTTQWTLPQTQAQIAALIPHQADMCLLEQVTAADATHIECLTHTHASTTHPLRVDNKLSAVHLCEYGAQAAAIHGALLAAQDNQRAPPGWLVALRDVRLSINYLDDEPSVMAQPLNVRAQLQHRSATGCSYEFQVFSAEQQLASGKVTVMNWAS